MVPGRDKLPKWSQKCDEMIELRIAVAAAGNRRTQTRCRLPPPPRQRASDKQGTLAYKPTSDTTWASVQVLGGWRWAFVGSGDLTGPSRAITYCNAVEDVCIELEKIQDDIRKAFPQFPEAMCNIATILTMCAMPKRFLHRCGVVGPKRVPHFWMYDPEHKVNVDLTAYQFSHISVTSAPFLVATDDEIDLLGYVPYSHEEWLAEFHIAVSDILLESLAEYNEIAKTNIKCTVDLAASARRPK